MIASRTVISTYGIGAFSGKLVYPREFVPNLQNESLVCSCELKL
jgi:hypothetical protein